MLQASLSNSISVGRLTALGRSRFPLRAAAARNLETNLSQMLAAVEAAGLPALVCTTASNEAGLRPLGDGGAALAAFEQAERAAAAEEVREIATLKFRRRRRCNRHGRLPGRRRFLALGRIEA